MAYNVILHEPTISTETMSESMYPDFNSRSKMRGIEIRYLPRTAKMQEVTRMPDMPPYLTGCINKHARQCDSCREYPPLVWQNE